MILIERVNLNHEIRTYFLSLGKACNLQCVYCHQGDGKPCFGKEDIMPSPRDVIKYFPREGNYRVVLYGGEPMLYWDFIVPFVSLMKERNPNIEFSMPTNGTLLTIERAKKINELGIAVGLSHDGKYFESTRRTKDILKINPDPFLTLQNRNISAVASKLNYDFYDIWGYFEEFKHKHGLQNRESIHIQVVKDVEGNTPGDLLIYNMPEYEQMLDKVFDNLYLSITKGDFSSYELMQYLPMIETLNWRLKSPNVKGVWCGADTQVCHMDVYGNLFPCHNSSKTFGNLKNIGIQAGGYNPNLNSTECKNCSAYIICGGGCPVSSDENRRAMCYTMYHQIVRLIDILDKVKGG